MPGRTFRRERGTQLREVGFAVGLFALLSIALLTLLVLIVDVIVEGAGSLLGQLLHRNHLSRGSE